MSELNLLGIANAITKALKPDTYGNPKQTQEEMTELMVIRSKVFNVLRESFEQCEIKEEEEDGGGLMEYALANFIKKQITAFTGESDMNDKQYNDLLQRVEALEQWVINKDQKGGNFGNIGNELGYRSLASDETIQEGDEVFSVLGVNNRWDKVDKSLIGSNPSKIGGLLGWRRKLSETWDAVPKNIGNEPGYRRLGADELVQAGDETFGVLGSEPWETANDSQVGHKASEVGGFFVWRRKLN